MTERAAHASAREALEAGDTVVTVNNRLARALLAAHGERMLAEGRRAWETPRVVPLEGLALGLWQELQMSPDVAAPRLLSAAETRALWRQVVDDAGGPALLSPTAAATGAARARELLLRHRATLRPADCGEHPDARAFAGWHRRFRQRLQRGGWLDPPAAVDALIRHLWDGHVSPPERLLFAGFDAFSPQQEDVRAALRAAGAEVRDLVAPTAGARGVRVAVATPDAEVDAAARWARGLLEAGHPGPIGVVILDLAERLDQVEACFEDVLHPAVSVAPRCSPAERAFNLSLGRPLGKLRIVRDALAVLELVTVPLDATTAGHLLLSPYLAGTEHERAGRLTVEALLRDQGVRAIRVRHLARLAARHGAPLLARRLVDALAHVPRARSRDSMAAHARRFADLLSTLGWPAGRALASGEYQAVHALQAELEALGAMDAVLPPCPAVAALALLRARLEETLFQPRTAPAPVQVMGVLEGAGMGFQALWLAGFHDAVWPAPETASPLLPPSLQRRHGMPGASPDRALARARQLTARLLGAAPEVVVSEAVRDGDTPLAPSPLLAQLPVTRTVPGWRGPLPDAAVHAAAPPPAWLADGRARPVGQDWRARGGSQVLTDQAACPFRAFARHRLRATGIERAPAPLDARSRGILAHRLMQALFGRVRGHAELTALDDDAREALAAEAADVAVAAVLRRHPGEIPRRLAQAERARMVAMAARWLSLEARRAPFQVEALEQRRVVRIGGLRLDLQLDRVDRVQGRRMLLDYKTGRARRGGWFGERPDDPQLPLYALALDAEGVTSAPVAAVCFARLKRGAEGFEGVAEDAAWAEGLAPLGSGRGPQREFQDMAGLKAHWGRVLGGLADAFAAGDAPVDPKPEACRYCDLRTLCRVDELGGSPGVEEGA